VSRDKTFSVARSVRKYFQSFVIFVDTGIKLQKGVGYLVNYVVILCLLAFYY